MIKVFGNQTHITKEDDYGLKDSVIKSLTDALADNNSKVIIDIYKSLHSSDVVDFINIISHEQRKTFINIVKHDFDLKILPELEKDIVEEIFSLLDIEVAIDFILKTEIYEVADLLENLDEETKEKLLKFLPGDKLKEIREIFSYPEDSVGRIVDKRAVLIPEFWTVGQILDYLHLNQDSLPDNFHRIFIINKAMKPIGAVRLSKLVSRQRSIKAKKIMETSLKLISSDIDKEEVAIIFRKYGLISELVVDKEQNIVGIITIEDIVEIIEDEAQEDIMLLGGVSDNDIYSDFSKTVMRRFPWLFLNLITAILSSMVIGLFQGIISKIAIVAVLMPVVASMGGNAATQSLTVMVRAISSRNISLEYTLKVILKETLAAATNGVLCALILGLVSYLLYYNLYLSIIFSFSTIVTLLFSGFIGTAIPIGLKKINIDPAIASGVLVTACTDITSFSVFLGLSSYLLK